jgi:hypothetical protein
LVVGDCQRMRLKASLMADANQYGHPRPTFQGAPAVKALRDEGRGGQAPLDAGRNGTIFSWRQQTPRTHDLGELLLVGEVRLVVRLHGPPRQKKTGP